MLRENNQKHTPPQLRGAIISLYQNQKTYSQIANELNISVSFNL